MRPQLNIPLDGNPELLEKLRKFCKVRGYRISDYCSRVLSAAIDKDISDFTNNQTSELPDERIKKLEVDLEQLRSRLDAIEADRNDSTLVRKLKELLDTNNYPTNGTAKLRKRIREIITEIA